MRKLATWQLMLLSTGGMIGAGWLFSPFYGFQTAGVGVVLSWIITAILTLVIGLSFAEVATIIPIVGGASRFIGVTHNRTISLVFIVLGWLSYVVYLPLEVQSAMQYLGFWFGDLVVTVGGSTTLSHIGLMVSLLIMVVLTWFNTLFLSNVARANTVISIWKILIPISIALILIVLFGSWDNIKIANLNHKFSFESVLLAISGSGLAFAFTGFQNGLILANSAKDPKKALPYSLFAPIIVGLILYLSLSLAFMTTMGERSLVAGATAPLLGLVAFFGVHIMVTVLFIDAIIAPLGTANVYTAVTSRILFGLGRDFLPNSFLTKLNKFASPAGCLWLNAIIGACFLLPFPTWAQLVSFLSSVVVFAYLSGPVTLLILRQELPEIERAFKLKHHKFIGYLGFACCSLLIYWSGVDNIIYLAIAVALIIVAYGLYLRKENVNFIAHITYNLFIVIYLCALISIEYLRHSNVIIFPFDNLCIIVVSLIACKVFVVNRVSKDDIKINLSRYNLES